MKQLTTRGRRIFMIFGLRTAGGCLGYLQVDTMTQRHASARTGSSCEVVLAGGSSHAELSPWVAPTANRAACTTYPLGVVS